MLDSLCPTPVALLVIMTAISPENSHIIVESAGGFPFVIHAINYSGSAKPLLLTSEISLNAAATHPVLQRKTLNHLLRPAKTIFSLLLLSDM